MGSSGGEQYWTTPDSLHHVLYSIHTPVNGRFLGTGFKGKDLLSVIVVEESHRYSCIVRGREGDRCELFPEIRKDFQTPTEASDLPSRPQTEPKDKRW